MIEASFLGLAAVFAAGTASFLSPCVLPLVPGYVSYIAGHSVHGAGQAPESRSHSATLGLAIVFVLGFSTVFIALGASATALGQWLLRYRYEANIIGGVTVIVFGLFMLGMLRRVSWIYRDLRFHPHIAGGRPAAAYVLGLAFGFGWTPCIGPVLGAILTMAAVSTQSSGIVLLAIYSAGLGVPFVLAAAFTSRLLKHLPALRGVGRQLQAFAGLVLILMGVAMLTGHLSSFAIWLLRVFPTLGSVG